MLQTVIKNYAETPYVSLRTELGDVEDKQQHEQCKRLYKTARASLQTKEKQDKAPPGTINK